MFSVDLTPRLVVSILVGRLDPVLTDVISSMSVNYCIGKIKSLEFLALMGYFS